MIRILVVDDDESLRTLIRHMLAPLGVAVEEAEDGRKAIRAYSARPADLVLCDLLMPGTDGLEVIRELTAFPGVRVVAMSSGGSLKGVDLLAIARRLGAADVLEKPFNQETLLATVHGLIPEFPTKPEK